MMTPTGCVPIPTVRVQLKENDQEMIINRFDFRPELHTRLDEDVLVFDTADLVRAERYPMTSAAAAYFVSQTDYDPTRHQLAGEA